MSWRLFRVVVIRQMAARINIPLRQWRNDSCGQKRLPYRQVSRLANKFEKLWKCGRQGGLHHSVVPYKLCNQINFL